MKKLLILGLVIVLLGGAQLTFAKTTTRIPLGLIQLPLSQAKIVFQNEFLSKWGSFGAGFGQFNEPWDVAVDVEDTIYVADAGNQRIQKFVYDGLLIASFNTGWYNYKVAVDSTGNIYTIDGSHSSIKKHASNGILVGVLGGDPGDGDGVFNQPQGIATDAESNLYIADTGNNRVQKLDQDGRFITKWGTAGSGDGEFESVYDLAIDSAGFVYTIDNATQRIQKFTSDGLFVTSWRFSGIGDEQFKNAKNISTDINGYVYVTDTGNNRVQKFDSQGNFIFKWGSFCDVDDGSGCASEGDGQFNHPEGVATDSQGNVYVIDSGNHRIQKFSGQLTKFLDQGLSIF